MKYLLGALTLLNLQLHESQAQPPRPNIVFILADDLGINDLGCYGRGDHETPHLDKLASEGLRFTCAYCAQPICSPSRAAIMTGLTPARLHLTTFLPGRANAASQKLLHPRIEPQLALEHRTIAEDLAQAGYRTACIGKWHLGGKGYGPERRGFGLVHTGTANTKPSASEGGKGEYDLTRAALQFIDSSKDQPFFLYLPHNNPHIPLAAKPELVARFAKSFNPTYAAMLHTLDETVGQILAKLDEHGLAKSTIVIFTSDNGGLHVLESPDSPATHNWPYRGGKGFLYEGGLRVPLIVRWPAHFQAGRLVRDPVVNTDWLPTLLELTGVKVSRPLDGVSIVPVLEGRTATERAFFWHFPHYTNQGGRPGGAAREGPWKLIEHYEDGKKELFRVDPEHGESLDRASEEPGRVSRMSAMLRDWKKSINAQENTLNPSFDPSLHKPLYLDRDASQVKIEATAANTADAWRDWRKGMNAAVAKQK